MTKYVLDKDDSTWPSDFPEEYLGDTGRLKVNAISNILCGLLNRVDELERRLDATLGAAE